MSDRLSAEELLSPQGWRKRLENQSATVVRDPDDEIVGFGSFHMERLDDHQIWIGFNGVDGKSLRIVLHNKRRAKVEITVEEDEGTGEPTDYQRLLAHIEAVEGELVAVRAELAQYQIDNAAVFEDMRQQLARAESVVKAANDTLTDVFRESLIRVSGTPVDSGSTTCRWCRNRDGMMPVHESWCLMTQILEWFKVYRAAYDAGEGREGGHTHQWKYDPKGKPRPYYRCLGCGEVRDGKYRWNGPAPIITKTSGEAGAAAQGLINCSDPFCKAKTHAAPDCSQRPVGSGPWCKYPMPEDGCSKCWYGLDEHTYGEGCTLQLEAGAQGEGKG